MTDKKQANGQHHLLAEAVVQIKKLKSRIRELQDSQHEPIAIIGMAGIFPAGMNSVDDYWKGLVDGIDGITDMGDRRWNMNHFYHPNAEVDGKMYTRRAALMDGIHLFDADFFGIAPREADNMDPQQRLLLQVVWQAIESAGIAPSHLLGSDTGVFVGAMNRDYIELQLSQGEIDDIGGYVSSGNISSVLSGRISYQLGLKGPCVSLDTACSSSLTAIHLAAASLRQKESSIALAGGVNAIISPSTTIAECKANMLSPDGLCKTFDSRANGYVRSEACGIVVLKRLSQALADGDPIRAVLRGSAVNQDGRSQGLTAPNGPSQQAVIRSALTNAGLKAEDVSYVEAHGTGTPLGDPIEVQALDAVYGEQRTTPLWLGSVKTNIGHAESAAGVAGLIKVILSMEHKQIPAHLHLEKVNPHISLDEQRIRIPQQLTTWDAPQRIAGVSSFGFSGTNAHAIIEEAPEQKRPAANLPARSHEFLCLSAKTKEALLALRDKYQDFLLESDKSLGDITYTAAIGRTHFPYRLAVQGDSLAALAQALNTVDDVDEVISDIQSAWLFSGQGAQYAGMGKVLYEQEPVFRITLDHCAELLSKELDYPLLDLLWGEHSDQINETQYTQPALFALGYSLAQLWQSWGHRPSVVMGHSVGEYIAACVAGVFDLASGLRLIAARGRLMQQQTESGAMAVIFATAEIVEAALLKTSNKQISIAAYNGPENTVVSGAVEGVDELIYLLTDYRHHRLSVSRGFHSPLMDRMLDDFRTVAESIDYQKPSLPLISNISGERADHNLCNADYWVEHVRAPVRFAQSMQTLSAMGSDLYLELGPSHTLIGMGRQCGVEGRWASSLVSGEPDNHSILNALSVLYKAGVELDWPTYYHDRAYCKVHLPTYAFQGKPYWLTGHRIEVDSVNDDPLAEWFYQVRWQALGEKTESKKTLSGHWLVLRDQQGISDHCIAQMRAAGVKVDEWTAYSDLAPDDASSFVERLKHSPDYDGIIYAWALDCADNSNLNSEQLQADEVMACGGLLHLTQALLAQTQARETQASVYKTPFNIVTRNAQPVHNASVTISQSPLVGMAKVIATEHPELNSVALDLGDGEKDQDLWWALTQPVEQESIALREQRLYAPVLERQLIERQYWRQPASISHDGVYLIVGGTGGLGLKVAQWLLEKGAEHLWLLSRSGSMSPAVASLVARYPEAKITIHKVDIGELASIAQLQNHLAESALSLRGIIHAAGIVDDATLATQSLSRFQNVTRSKISGLWHLHELVASLPYELEHFISFSSVASVFGTAGQINYVAANSFVDSFTRYQRSQKQNAVSVNWGAWSEVGMATADKAQKNLNRNSLFLPIEPEEGIAALDYVVNSQSGSAIVSPINWEVFKQFVIANNLSSKHYFLQQMMDFNGTDSSDSSAIDFSQFNELERIKKIEQAIIARVRTVMNIDTKTTLDSERPLQEMGLDSLMALELRNALGKLMGNTYPASLLFDYPSIEKLTKKLASEFAEKTKASSRQVFSKKNVSAKNDDAIAIIGMSCRFPGAAHNVDEYWSLLANAQCGIETLENKRWSKQHYFNQKPQTKGKTYLDFAGLLDEVELFDAPFFGLSPLEAMYLDPQQRLLLENTWSAIEDAGYSPKAFSGSNTAVYVGLMAGDYAYLWQEQDKDEIGPYLATGNALSTASGRLSYVFGLEGPSLSIDTACSSSLVAVHQGCQAIRSGDAEQAIVGGVNLLLHPTNSISLSQAGMLATDGLCKTFDSRANGYVRSEGCGMVVLKPLSQALADGDPIRAVLRGSAVNQDGRSQGLTAPNGPSQQAVIRSALTNAGLKAEDVSYVEAHGTGTPLGDPIEVQALDAVYGEQRSNPLWLGSVKTNIGHAESAAGVAGLIKVILSMEHKKIPAHLHLEKLNPHISLDEERIRIPQQLTTWGAPQRIAGVSSFGFSGTNAHAIIEEAPEQKRPVANLPTRSHELLCLSAKTKDALLALRDKYHDFLLESDKSLGDITYTAAIGRTHFPYRLAVQGDSPAALAQALNTVGDVDEVISDIQSAWLFSGQGAEYAGMGKVLYEQEPVFRITLDHCAELLITELDYPLLDLLWGEHSDQINETQYTQPALFALGYSLAQLWQSWGHTPSVVMGHSVGEYIAACVAGVFDLASGLRLIAARGRLMQQQTDKGAMAVIFAPAEIVEAALLKTSNKQISIAAYNGPENTVVSGAVEGVDELIYLLTDYRHHRLSVSRGFHSPLMDSMLDDFRTVAESIEYHTPSLPLISNVSAQAEDSRLCSADYWVEHVRAPVRFAQSMQSLSAMGAELYLELGPSHTLIGMGRQCGVEGRWASSLVSGEPDSHSILNALSVLYKAGVELDWDAYYHDRAYCKVHLPTYAFQGKPYWLTGHRIEVDSVNDDPLAEWFYQVRWQALGEKTESKKTLSGHWLVLRDQQGISDHCIAQMRAAGVKVDEWTAHSDLAPDDAPSFVERFKNSPAYDGIIYAWALDCADNSNLSSEQLQADEVMACGGLLHLTQALLKQTSVYKTPLYIVTRNAQPVHNASVTISQSPLVGMAKVIATEHPELNSVALDLGDGEKDQDLWWALTQPVEQESIALREQRLYVPVLEAVTIADQQEALQQDKSPLKAEGHYLISGGTGGLGLLLAEYLIDAGVKHLHLLARTNVLTQTIDTLSEQQLLAREKIQGWKKAGIDIAISAVNLSSRRAVKQLLKLFAKQSFNGVFHLAGSNQPTPLKQLDLNTFCTVADSKLLGAWQLHEALTQSKHSPDFFTVFSSIASVWGSSEMAHYSAANEFANALVSLRNSTGQLSFAIQWGPWEEAGMAVGDYVASAKAIGLEGISSAQGMQAMSRVLTATVHRPMVAPVDWQTFLPVFDPDNRRGLLQSLSKTYRPEPHQAQIGDKGSHDKGADNKESMESMLAQMNGDEALAYVSDYVLSQCSALLRLDDSTVLTEETRLHEAGMDSILAIHLKEILTQQFSKKIASTIIFDYPTVKEMAAYLVEGLVDTEADDTLPSSLLDSLTRIEGMENDEIEDVLNDL